MACESLIIMKTTHPTLYLEEHPNKAKWIRWGVLIGALLILTLIGVAVWDLTAAFLALWLFVIIPVAVIWGIIWVARYRTSK